MKFKHIALMVAAMLGMAGCGDDSEFRVTGTIEGLGTQNLRVIYYTNTGLKSLTSTAVDGKFNFTGNAPAETLVEIFTSDRVPLMRLAIRNGETVEVKIDRAEPYKLTLKGNDVSKRMAAFMRDNRDLLTAGNREAINAAVADYVGRNTKDLSSTILLLTEYDAFGHEQEADSLLNMIDAKSRPEFLTENIEAGLAQRNAAVEHARMLPLRLYTDADSMTTFNTSGSAYSLLIFTRTGRERADSLRYQLSVLMGRTDASRLRVVDISLATDSADWHSQPHILPADKDGISAWMPGAIASVPVKQLAITRTPYFVVADSAGTQIYRGASLKDAISKVP